jgi:hypothetical protein
MCKWIPPPLTCSLAVVSERDKRASLLSVDGLVFQIDLIDALLFEVFLSRGNVTKHFMAVIYKWPK